MKLWLLTFMYRGRPVTRFNCGYDNFASAIVAAEDEESAKRIHPTHLGVEEHAAARGETPSERWVLDRNDGKSWTTYFNDGSSMDDHDWAESIDDVVAVYIGEAAPHIKEGCVMSDYVNG